jgi:Fe-S-cluster-containing hydrogenase component 2
MVERLTPDDARSTKKKRSEASDPIVANKCDLCLTDDYDPPCVACCPYDAAKRVDPLEFFPDLKRWGNLAERR